MAWRVPLLAYAQEGIAVCHAVIHGVLARTGAEHLLHQLWARRGLLPCASGSDMSKPLARMQRTKRASAATYCFCSE